MRELTGRGLVLGALITTVFTAANVYLGLRVGLTFASSIPAAVISMAVLRLARGGTILENNIVQTEASAAGTLSSIIFVLPGLVMVGRWHGFPWAETAGLCAAGGVLGIVFTIPLRRAMVLESGLAFPEGTAAAEILEAGDRGGGRGAGALAGAGLVSALFALCSGGFGLLGAGVAATLPLGGAVVRLACGFSLALVGAGYLMGVASGIAIAIGFALSWLVAVPALTALAPNPDHLAPAAFAMSVWAHRVRFIGAGTIAVAAVSTLATLAPAIRRGVRATREAARRGAAAADTERDLSPRAIALLAAASLALLFAVLFAFLGADGWGAPARLGLALAGTAFAAGFGFLVAATCGYMSGLVGSSASPISGIAIVAVTLVSLLLLLLPSGGSGPVALALFVTSAILAMATISNDNLQDLKTGAIVGASPRRQQIALVVGVAVGAAVIPPVLELLYRAYGFPGALPRPGMREGSALAAPQATLMAAIANGILGHRLDWSMIGIGVALGIALLGVDLALRRRTATLRLPLLPVGIGLYLPPSIGSTLVIGAVLSLLAARGRAGAASRGVLLASGLIVGESLVGVVLAAVIGATGRDDALTLVGPGFAPVAAGLGACAFALVCAGLLRAARPGPAVAPDGGFPPVARRG